MLQILGIDKPFQEDNDSLYRAGKDWQITKTRERVASVRPKKQGARVLGWTYTLLQCPVFLITITISESICCQAQSRT